MPFGRGNFDGLRLAAHVLDLDFVLQQFGLHACWVGVALVDLVDRHDDRNLRRFCVRNRLDRLRHDAVVRGHHENNEIGDLGAARTHRGKRGVAGRIEEGDFLAALQRHLIGADMLGDAAGFASDHVGLAQRVEQRGLAVIDMAHDGDDWRTGTQRCILVGGALQALQNVGFGNALDGVPVFRSDELGGVGIDRVVDRRHHAVLHQHLDDVHCAARHTVGEFGNCDRFGDGHFARTGWRSLHRRALVHALEVPAVGGDGAHTLVVAR